MGLQVICLWAFFYCIHIMDLAKPLSRLVAYLSEKG